MKRPIYEVAPKTIVGITTEIMKGITGRDLGQ